MFNTVCYDIPTAIIPPSNLQYLKNFIYLTNMQKVKILETNKDTTRPGHNSNGTNNEYEPLIGETSYRFVIVVVYCLLSFANGMQWVTFSAIAKQFRDNYDLTQYQVDLFSTLYMIVYPFLSFPSSYIIDNKSIRLGVNTTIIL
jgi:fucose permease